MINIELKNIDVTAKEEEMIHKKLEKVLHFCKKMNDESTKIDLKFIEETKNFIKGTLDIKLPKGHLRAEVVSDKNLISITEKLNQEMEPQIEKYKNKNMNHIHH